MTSTWWDEPGAGRNHHGSRSTGRRRREGFRIRHLASEIKAADERIDIPERRALRFAAARQGRTWHEGSAASGRARRPYSQETTKTPEPVWLPIDTPP
jgi:hypothetical protein